MAYHPEKHHRRSIRLRGYDYTQPGVYFITICTHGRMCLFGDVVDGVMQMNACGRIVADEWHRTAVVRSDVVLDAFVVMPNHVHGIIGIVEIDDDGDVSHGVGGVLHGGVSHGGVSHGGVSRYDPTGGVQSPSQTVGAIVRGFKGAATKRINQLRHRPGAPVWQRGYYDHIIRNERALDRIRRYIVENPSRWRLDRNR